MRNVPSTQGALTLRLCNKSSYLGMTVYSTCLYEAKWEKRYMFQRPNGFDIKNTSDYMVPKRIYLMKSVSIELWHNPLCLQPGKSQ